MGSTDEFIWTTRDGQQIPLSQMTDSHLRNATGLVERTLAKMRDTQSSMWSAYSYVSGEAAERCLESDMDSLEEEISETSITLERLWAEISRRGL